jgi:NADH-quinone oxidoreductase subunit H
VLIPSQIGWILLVATIQGVRNEGYDIRNIVFVAAGAIVVVLVGTWMWELGRRAPVPVAVQAPFDPFAGGFPVPPLPGQIAAPLGRRAATLTVPAVPITAEAGDA